VGAVDGQAAPGREIGEARPAERYKRGNLQALSGIAALAGALGDGPGCFAVDHWRTLHRRNLAGTSLIAVATRSSFRA